MKKCIVLILSIMMILPLILTANAAEETQALTKREAQELVAEAFSFYYIVRCGSYENYNSYIDIPHEDISDVFIDKNIAVDRYPRYYEVIEEELPNGSFDAMQEYAQTIYSADIASYAYQYAFCFKPSPESDYIEYPLFYQNTDGKLYAKPGVPQHNKYFYPYVTSGSILTTTTDIKNNIENLEVELISSNSKSATALVSLKIGVSETNTTPYQIECNFANTDSGWRIAESEFSNLMMYDRRQASPDTGDNSINSIIIFSALAVTALIPAAVLLKKRRSF